MNKTTRSERLRVLSADYEIMFAERGGVTPSDPLEFHLHHLARYWSRLLGFCRQEPSHCADMIETDLGVCVQMGSEFTNKFIGPDSPVCSEWRNYWTQTQSILHDRPITIETVESASQAFDACLAKLKYDPWANRRLA